MLERLGKDRFVICFGAWIGRSERTKGAGWVVWQQWQQVAAAQDSRSSAERVWVQAPESLGKEGKDGQQSVGN